MPNIKTINFPQAQLQMTGYILPTDWLPLPGYRLAVDSGWAKDVIKLMQGSGVIKVGRLGW